LRFFQGGGETETFPTPRITPGLTRKIGNSTAASAPHFVRTLARLIGLEPPSGSVPILKWAAAAAQSDHTP